MIAYSRRGACPALSAPMATGDGLLVRLNPVAGGLTPDGVMALAQSARRHGNGVMEITARGSLQVRGLSAETASLFAAEVDALGIAVHTGVPVETGPLVALDPDEIADPLPIAETLRASIAAAGLSGRLGPKVSVVVDGGGRFGMGSVLADVRLTATRSGEDVFWNVSVGGDGKTAALLGTAAADTAAQAALAILDAVASLGREARARDLTAEQLWPALSNLGVQSSLSPADSEPRHENEAQDGRIPLGIFELVDGRAALAIALPFGHADGDRLIDLTVQANVLGANEIRFAPQRILLLLCDSRSAAEALQDAAGTLGFVTNPADARLAIAACPGAPACASGRISARETAREIATAFGDLFDGSLSLHISGCAKGCARHAPATVTLVGGEKGAGFVAEGTARDDPAAYTAPDGAAQGFGRLATLLRAEQRPGETMATCLSRIGAARAAEAFGQG